jgi:hypothetical protein
MNIFSIKKGLSWILLIPVLLAQLILMVVCHTTFIYLVVSVVFAAAFIALSRASWLRSNRLYIRAGYLNSQVLKHPSSRNLFILSLLVMIATMFIATLWVLLLTVLSTGLYALAINQVIKAERTTTAKLSKATKKLEVGTLVGIIPFDTCEDDYEESIGY